MYRKQIFITLHATSSGYNWGINIKNHTINIINIKNGTEISFKILANFTQQT